MEFKGTLDWKDTSTNKLRIQLDAKTADIRVGGNGSGGDIEVRNDHGNTKIRMSAGGAEAPVLGTGGLQAALETIRLSGEDGTITVGGPGEDGHIRLRDSGSRERIHLNAAAADIRIGGNGKGGDIHVKDDANATRILLNAGGADFQILPGQSQPVLRLEGSTATINAGTEEVGGNIVVHSQFGLGPIHLKGDNAEITGGRLALKKDGKTQIRLDAHGSNLFIGGNGFGGNIWLFKSSGDNLNGAQAAIHVGGEDGVISFRNADCAEDFQVEDAENVEPGTVLSIGDDSRLQVCRDAYDKRVAGVVAGAGECRPGIVLGRKEEEQKSSLPVALVGRVFCKVDSSHGAVEVGDLLTTSPTPGHAMKAGDPFKAFGAVIGKALAPLTNGAGMIPILVSLQ